MNVDKMLFAQVMEYVPWKTFGRILDWAHILGQDRDPQGYCAIRLFVSTAF